MRVGIRSRGIRGFAIGLAVLALSVVAGAQTAAWDQERVTALAAELYEDVKDLKIIVQKNPDQPIGGARRAQYEARDQLRVLQGQARHLREDLQAGAGHEETVTSFKRIQLIRRDLEALARKAAVRENTMAAVMQVQDVLRRMAPYYDVDGGGEDGA